jgi:hypothetical protein
MRDLFDRVCLINLRRRPDRLAAFRTDVLAKGWPFRDPEIFPAVDGKIVPTPRGWQSTDAVYGCLQSHVTILQSAILDDVKSLLVLEDDATVMSTFLEDCERFFAAVPSDWEQLMLGGQHIQGPRKVSDGVVRCMNCQRTHAYAIRGRFMRDLYSIWRAPSSQTHCDHIMGPLQPGYNVYAPDPFLFGQVKSQSDINGRVNPTKFWKSPKGEEHVFVLDCPKEVVAALRESGIHTGYDRNPTSDIDNGLLTVFKEDKPDLNAFVRWLHDLQWECVSQENVYLGIWHPQVTVELVKRFWAGPVVLIMAPTIKEAREQIQASIKRPMIPAPKRFIVLLETGRATASQLRSYGWHTGYWRDPVTDLDNGLREWEANGRDIGQLGTIVKTLQMECERIANGIAVVWHHGVTADMLRQATDADVIVAKGTVEECLATIRR